MHSRVPLNPFFIKSFLTFFFFSILIITTQVVIFVSKVKRAVELSRLLEDCNFPSICIHSQLKQEERIARFKAFKDFSKRILVSTDLFGRGVFINKLCIFL